MRSGIVVVVVVVVVGFDIRFVCGIEIGFSGIGCVRTVVNHPVEGDGRGIGYFRQYVSVLAGLGWEEHIQDALYLVGIGIHG
ncbi:hypothetical protein QBC37DRAFT_435633 [Rhypophila decipiens]|uniref:Uncharacterized protein n=1 Tax=Rhypophila decipiens TaxID=261697 RepID=A0AAN6XSW5_9PEZI|nr:hypothetical protein QBC37DRAFT_435633 [Rhypophila decipiens]